MTTVDFETNSGHPPEWYAARATGIGGSDAAAIAGLSHWKTPLEVYCDKIGEGCDTKTTAMRRGSLLEPVVRQMYCDETGNTVEVPDKMIRHPDHSFMVANLDGVVSNDLIYEGKTSRDRTGWGEPGSADIPIVYTCQVQHYMLVANAARADVAVMFGDFELVVYHVEADAEFQELLLASETKFWQCVKNRIPPEPITSDDARRRWPRNITPSEVASGDDLHVARVLKAAKANIKILGEIKARAETMLKSSIKDSEGLHAGDESICTWKSAKATKRFDAKLFQRENPELYNQYVTEGKPQRRFLLKGNAKCLQKANTILPRIPEGLLQIPEEQG